MCITNLLSFLYVNHCQTLSHWICLFRAKSSSNRIRSNQSTEIKYTNIRERGGGGRGEGGGGNTLAYIWRINSLELNFKKNLQECLSKRRVANTAELIARLSFFLSWVRSCTSSFLVAIFCSPEWARSCSEVCLAHEMPWYQPTIYLTERNRNIRLPI